MVWWLFARARAQLGVLAVQLAPEVGDLGARRGGVEPRVSDERLVQRAPRERERLAAARAHAYVVERVCVRPRPVGRVLRVSR